MSTWRPARRALAASAILVTALTGALEVWLGGSSWHLFGAYTYVLIAMLGLFSPAAIAVQVVWGQVLIGSLLVAQDGPYHLLLAPLVAGVIVTAELLAVVARMDTPFDSDPRDDLPRAGTAALIGGGVFGVVLFLSSVPGPRGIVAIVLALGACVVLAALMVQVNQPGGDVSEMGPAETQLDTVGRSD